MDKFERHLMRIAANRLGSLVIKKAHLLLFAYFGILYLVIIFANYLETKETFLSGEKILGILMSIILIFLAVESIIAPKTTPTTITLGDKPETKISGTLNDEQIEKVEALVAKVNEINNPKPIDTDGNNFIKTKTRISSEISRLKNYATIHLYMGIVITIAAILVLTVTLINNPATGSIEDKIFSLIPRILLSIFIELLAFFFIRMYKANFAEIKYYLNELTNTDMQEAALLHAEKQKLECENEIVSNLSKTERNFILARGQSTVHFQSENSDAYTLRETIRALKDVLANAKKTDQSSTKI